MKSEDVVFGEFAPTMVRGGGGVTTLNYTILHYTFGFFCVWCRGKRGIKERLSFENSCNSGKGMWNHCVCYIASLGIVLGYLKIFE